MHDVTEGGIATAALELAEAGGLSPALDFDDIVWLPETLAVCEEARSSIRLDCSARARFLAAVAPDAVDAALAANCRRRSVCNAAAIGRVGTGIRATLSPRRADATAPPFRAGRSASGIGTEQQRTGADVSAQPATVGELKDSGYQPRNRPGRDSRQPDQAARGRRPALPRDPRLRRQPSSRRWRMRGCWPSRDVIFLGERGQAKSRMIRAITGLLDEETPVLEGVEIYEEPLAPDLGGGQGEDRRTGRRRAYPLDPARRPLRREAGHARYHDRRPDRRGRPDQGGRGPLSVGRVDHPLPA